MAKGEPPLADIHPMRVLFMIPRENPPQLEEHFSGSMKEFVALCLRKSPAERPSAKDLLKHRFIQNATKSPQLLERIRERRKYNEIDEETQKDRESMYDHGTSTIKMLKDTNRFSYPSGMGTLQGTGTIRSTAKPNTQVTQGTGTGTVRAPLPMGGSQIIETLRSSLRLRTTTKEADRVNQLASPLKSASNGSPSRLSSQEEESERDDEEALGSPAEDDNFSECGSGTVIIHSSEISKNAAFNQKVKSPSRTSSSDDVFISGTVVLRGKNDEPETPPYASKSRLGIQDKTANIFSEDSATNLAEAKAAMQVALKKGNACERSSANKKTKDSSENKMIERTTTASFYRDKIEEQRVPNKSDGSSYALTHNRAYAAASSPILLLLMVPALRETTADLSEGTAPTAVEESLMDMEHLLPGSCEVLMIKFLRQLQSSKDPSVKRIKDLAVSIFSEKTAEMSQDSHGGKRQPSANSSDIHNLSPLARFLLSRWQSHVSQDLNK